MMVSARTSFAFDILSLSRKKVCKETRAVGTLYGFIAKAHNASGNSLRSDTTSDKNCAFVTHPSGAPPMLEKQI